MKLTIEQRKAFQTENKAYYFDNGFLKGLTDFNTLIEEKIVQMDRIESELYKKGESIRKAYYVQKIKNLTSHIIKEIINFNNFPKKRDCTDYQKIQRKNCLYRLTLMQIDYAIILRFYPDLAHKLGYTNIAKQILIRFK